MSRNENFAKNIRSTFWGILYNSIILGNFFLSFQGRDWTLIETGRIDVLWRGVLLPRRIIRRRKIVIIGAVSSLMQILEKVSQRTYVNSSITGSEIRKNNPLEFRKLLQFVDELELTVFFYSYTGTCDVLGVFTGMERKRLKKNESSRFKKNCYSIYNSQWPEWWNRMKNLSK